VTAEHLTDGWEPDLPVSDTLLRRFLFNLAAFNELPAVAAGARVLRRGDLAAADLGRPAAMHNAATLLRPLGGPPPPPVPPGLRAERVTRVVGLRDWERVAVDGFPYRELQPYRPGVLLEERVLADERLRLWVGYEDDRPVCMGTLFVDAGVAAFSLGVTLPEARRRGYWAAMAGVRLLEEPDLPAVGIFSDMSRPPAEALGFLPLTRFTLWHRPRPAMPTS
jgi:hypothetical protein